MSPGRGSRPRPKPLTPEEGRIVRQVRRETRAVGVSLRRLERLRDEERSRRKESAGGEDGCRVFLLRVLEHALLQVEEGWAELAGCFSKEGLVFARRQAKKRKG